MRTILGVSFNYYKNIHFIIFINWKKYNDSLQEFKQF